MPSSRYEPYSPTFRGTPEGSFCVKGPGMGFGYYGGVLFPSFTCPTREEAERASTMCNEAFHAGISHAQREMKKALGIPT